MIANFVPSGDQAGAKLPSIVGLKFSRATIEAAKGTFIAFATAPGKEALDGSGSKSPYIKHLTQMIGQKGLPLEQVFKEVRKAVIAETNGDQVPWENSSLMGDFYSTK